MSKPRTKFKAISNSERGKKIQLFNVYNTFHIEDNKGTHLYEMSFAVVDKDILIVEHSNQTAHVQKAKGGGYIMDYTEAMDILTNITNK